MSSWSKFTTYICASLFFVLTAASAGFGDSAENQSLSVSTYQPPVDFHTRLEDFLQFSGGISLNEEWRAFGNTDVWVFFLEDVDDVELLPSLVSEVFGSLNVRKLAFSHIAVIHFESGREVTFAFFVASNLSDRSSLGCRAAIILAAFVTEASEVSVSDFLNQCDLA